MGILDNLNGVRARIENAARRAGRDPGEITLVAVTKTVPADRIREAIGCGVRDFGENRAQELAQKYSGLPREVRWHFIGHLQTNKVRKIIDKVALIHSLDRWPLALEIDGAAREKGLVVDTLIQVNVAGEETKFGLSPDETLDFAAAVSRLPGLAVRGLMTIAPWCEDPEEVRPVFKEMRQLAEKIKEKVPFVHMDFLSMGMTGDFTVAVEEGANILRIGTAIFGAR